MSQTQGIDEFLNQLLLKHDEQPHQLLQYLFWIQRTYSHIPARCINWLSNRLGTTETEIRSVIQFYSFLHEIPRGQFDILFSDSITDHMLGSRLLFEQLCDGLQVKPGIPRAGGRVCVELTSCTGMCDQGPAILVNGQAITHLTAARIEQIADLVETSTPVTHWPDDFFNVRNNIYRRDLLLSNDTWQSSVLESFIRRGADSTLEEIEAAKLRGRGGAGFNTAMKWTFCRNTSAKQRYVVCNADEGEPGTFKDRVLLTDYADAVFDGMTVCAGIIGADKGFLYLRAEYSYLLPALEKTLEQRRQRAQLGNNILGTSGFDFDIEIHMGAGAYICGEESSLLESLEGKRGIPRKRPPYPATHGYLGQPTVVNNVETFMAAAAITRHGGEWFRSSGTDSSSGTKILSISGDCKRPGIYEYPFGVTINQVLSECGADDVQAVQVAGAAGNTIPPEEFDRSIAFDDFSTGGSFMIFDHNRQLLDMVQNFAHFFVHESCGFCTPCRVGGSLLKDLVDKAHAGRASTYDLEEMKNIGALMRDTSHCGLGTTAPNPVLDTLDKFPYLYTDKLRKTELNPSFDLDAALQEARDISGRNDDEAHIKQT